MDYFCTVNAQNSAIAEHVFQYFVTLEEDRPAPRSHCYECIVSMIRQIYPSVAFQSLMLAIQYYHMERNFSIRND